MGEGNIEVKVQEAGTVLLILGTMLGGGTFCSDTRRTPFPLLVADGLQWKEKRAQTDCAGEVNGPWGVEYPQTDMSGLNRLRAKADSLAL